MNARIMKLKKEFPNYKSTYQFLTKTNDLGEIVPVEFETDEELDVYVEDLLNNKGFSKDDFIIVYQKEYEIKVDIIE